MFQWGGQSKEGQNQRSLLLTVTMLESLFQVLFLLALLLLSLGWGFIRRHLRSKEGWLVSVARFFYCSAAVSLPVWGIWSGWFRWRIRSFRQTSGLNPSVVKKRAPRLFIGGFKNSWYPASTVWLVLMPCWDCLKSGSTSSICAAVGRGEAGWWGLRHSHVCWVARDPEIAERLPVNPKTCLPMPCHWACSQYWYPCL